MIGLTVPQLACNCELVWCRANCFIKNSVLVWFSSINNNEFVHLKLQSTCMCMHAILNVQLATNWLAHKIPLALAFLMD